MTKFICSFLLMIVFISVIQDAYAGGEGLLLSEESERECENRCSIAMDKKACLTYCNISCGKCFCVPSGTYSHKEECPCYNNWKTKRGTPKCP
ncbi:gibberellin-regulated protein 12-like [Vicia villosa]|uniref:gibberellin-regulated protein 12-like n=1 Tax=Vicia villosa TaxID=3911 RepID=UPI00273CBC51|nr:gibberellin-regulated protein 12-like [Vicia villosa]